MILTLFISICDIQVPQLYTIVILNPWTTSLKTCPTLSVYSVIKYLSAIHIYQILLSKATYSKGANQHIGSSLRFSIFPKDSLTCRPGELNLGPGPSDISMLALPLNNSHPFMNTTAKWSHSTPFIDHESETCETSIYFCRVAEKNNRVDVKKEMVGMMSSVL